MNKLTVVAALTVVVAALLSPSVVGDDKAAKSGLPKLVDLGADFGRI